MRHRYLTGAALALMPLWAIAACSGEASDAGLFGDTSHGAGNLNGADEDGDLGTSLFASTFPGAGTSGSGDPLVAGLGPETAGQCPSGVVAAPGVSTPVETICLYSEDNADEPAATIEQVVEIVNTREWVHVRLILNPAFVDNSYGDTAIGWEEREKPGKAPAAAPDAGVPNPPPLGPAAPPPDGPAPKPEKPKPAGDQPGMGDKAPHTFRDLVGSDHAEIKLFDDDGVVSLHFKLDYISESADAPSGYASLGVSGGEGKLIVGEPESFLAATTSLDRNLNACGLGDFLESSPATDADYTPNADASEWDYRVVYEVWVDPAAFGTSGFGTASIAFVHASPSKFTNDTATVTPGPCPPTTDAPPPNDDGVVVFPPEENPTIR